MCDSERRTARRHRGTRPSGLVVVPSSSAHRVTGQHDVGGLAGQEVRDDQ